MTNREWLESLSDEELAKRMTGCVKCSFCDVCHGDYNCDIGHLKWLQAEHKAEGDNGDKKE